MVEISATIKYLRVGPRKLREIAEMIKDLTVNQALNQLKFIQRSAGRPLILSIQSALNNARSNLKLTSEDFLIKTLEINEAPRLKRWRAVSRGTAHQYKHRASHIKIVLTELITERKVDGGKS